MCYEVGPYRLPQSVRDEPEKKQLKEEKLLKFVGRYLLKLHYLSVIFVLYK
jgi:hypothetical protein